jgi:amidase
MASAEPLPGATMDETAAMEAMTTLVNLRDTNLSAVMEAIGACPARTFPIPNSASNAKRALDFTPFVEAMAALSAEQVAAIDGAISGKTLPEIQALLDAGDFTSEQLVLYYLQRIQQYDVDALNSVMALNPDALAIARRLDAERASGAGRGALHGIPVLLKDNIATGDQMATTAGSYALKDWQATRDAFLVQQLRAAGAVILGKANLSEWAGHLDPCAPNGFTAMGGQTRHPYGPFDPLGSSSGSAVSVAAGLTSVSVGTETAGSLVQPARTSGVVGMRPSQGLVSRDYVVPLEANLDTPGPIGRSVTDVAILLTALAGADANDPKTADAAALADTDFTQSLSAEAAQGLKVGVVQFDLTAARTFMAAGAVTPEELDAMTPEDWQDMTDTLAAAGQLPGAATQEVIDALRSQGVEVVVIKESELPQALTNPELALLDFGHQDAVDRFLTNLDAPAPISSLAEAVASGDEDPANRIPYGQRYLEWSVNNPTTAEEYAAAVAAAQAIASDWLKGLLQAYGVDVLMMGTSYTEAGPAGVPALNIPIGVNPATGEPLGVYLTGDYLSDAQLLAVGYALEQALNLQLRPDLDTTLQQIKAVTGQ